MIDLSLDRGHEVDLADGADSTVRVRLQPSWALVPGSRLMTRLEHHVDRGCRPLPLVAEVVPVPV